MTDDEGLPDMRFGAGMLTRLEGGDRFVLPIRDAGAPAQPMRLDGQMGIKEKDESIEGAQAREGTEETVFVREEDGEVKVGVPETIRGTDLEHNLVRTYRKAGRDDESPLPEMDDVFYYGASQEVPDNMPVIEAEDGGYETGYTLEISGDVSLEMMNDHVVDLDQQEIMDGDISVYDLEYMEAEEGVIHFDRPTAALNPATDEVSVFRSGEIQYQGEVEGLRDFLSEEYGWDMEEVENAATVKVGARLDAYEDDLGQQSYREFVNSEYMEALEDLGRLDDFPAP